MESRKMVLMIICAGRKGDTCVKQTASVSLIYDAGNPKPMLWDNLEGQGGEGCGRGFRIQGTYIDLWLIHIDIWQEPSQYCEVTILKLK